MISIYYLLTIRYGISHSRVAQMYEPFMHAYALIPSMSTAIIGAANKMYFNETSPCCIGDVCQSLGNFSEGNISGEGLWIVMASSVYNGINMCMITYCMILLYITLRQRNLVMERHMFQTLSGLTVPNRKPSATSFAATGALK